MSLYDDEELGAPATDVAVGWSRGVQLMQSQMQLKQSKPGHNPNSTPTPSGYHAKPRTSSGPVLAPVIDLKSKRSHHSSDNDSGGGKFPFNKISRSTGGSDKSLLPLNDPNWQVVNEYDPLWPNDYLKVVQELRGDKRKTDDEDSMHDARRRRYTEAGREKARERFNKDKNATENKTGELSGFGRRPRTEDDYSDDEDDRPRRKSSSSSSSSSARRSTGSTTGGAAIAPPPSLTETSNPPTPSSGESTSSVSNSATGLGVAAKIMAKYGYKHGQGLGRTEQGMSQALAVEKTSKRGGRIVHEKDLMPPPMFGESFKTPQQHSPGGATTPPALVDTDEFPPPDSYTTTEEEANKPSITDLMKNPSKVVLCKNMVGPGEVDDDLEPEIKEECHGKYGDVGNVVIFELPNVVPEEAVRIFIEFKRVESAIKAVVDLNGRFFGGREVRACFYDVAKFKKLELND